MATISAATWAALALSAAAAGTQYVNTERTAKRQDNALATQIRNQGAKQRQADARVGEQIDDLAASNADAARNESLDSYMQTLRRNHGQTKAGLAPSFGSETFQRDAADAAQGVDRYATETADLMSKIDAPVCQRQQEGFGFGRLGTDLGLLQRDASGQNYVDQLRLMAIRRNSGLDFAAGLMNVGAQGISANANVTKAYTMPDPQYGQYGGAYTTTLGGDGWRNAYVAKR